MTRRGALNRAQRRYSHGPTKDEMRGGKGLVLLWSHPPPLPAHPHTHTRSPFIMLLIFSYSFVSNHQPVVAAVGQRRDNGAQCCRGIIQPRPGNQLVRPSSRASRACGSRPLSFHALTHLGQVKSITKITHIKVEPKQS